MRSRGQLRYGEDESTLAYGSERSGAQPRESNPVERRRREAGPGTEAARLALGRPAKSAQE